MTSPRVLHLVPTITGGGAAKVMADIASFQVRAGIRVTIASVAPPTDMPPWWSSICIPWDEVIHLDWPLRYDKINNLRQVSQRTRSVIQSLDSEVIHSHLWAADFIASLAIGREQRLHIAHLHNQEPFKSKSNWKAALRRQVSNWAFRRSRTRYIACSQAVKEFNVEHMGWNPAHIDVLRNWVDVHHLQPAKKPPPQSPLRIGSAGWFIPRKGHIDLLAACAKLVRSGLNIVVSLAGEGELREQYVAFAREQGIEDRLELPGNLSAMKDFYQSLDLFVLPSVEEGLPLVVLEAMACGLPVVASDLPGMSQAVIHEENGYLFPPSDRQALTDRLRNVLTDPGKRHRFSEASRRIAVDQFSAKLVPTAIESIYQRRQAERFA